MSLAGERVVVVGGTGGMGAATVRASRRLGAEVVSAGRRPVAERDRVDGVHEVVVDSTDEASVRAMFESVGESSTTSSSTASPGQSGVFLEQDLAHARTFMDRKFFGELGVRPVRGAPAPISRLDHLRHGRGGGPPERREVDDHSGISPPSSSLTRALAVELGPRRVNADRPGYTDSERRLRMFLSDDEREELRRRVAEGAPVRRLGTPEDVAQAAVFLMTCLQVTGTVLEVSGGETLVNSMD